MPCLSSKVKGQPRVIFFDAVGTLLKLREPVGRTYAKVAQAFGAETGEEPMEAAFRAVWKELPHRPPSSGPRPQDDRDWWEALAWKVLTSSSKLPSSFDRTAWFGQLYTHFAEAKAWELYEDVLPALEFFHGKTRLAVLSNFDGRLRGILAQLKIAPVFERIFISSELGCEKPHSVIFERALREMNASADECWHVGDDPVRDWQGAEDAGITAIPLDRRNYSLRNLTSQYEEILKAQAS